MRSYTKRWIAGLLGVLLLFTSGCAATEEPSTPAVQPLSQPQYPQMAPYPDESAFLNKVTGEFDDEGFREVYDAWRQDQQAQKNQPEGYADGLNSFFAASIPAILKPEGENVLCSPLNLYLALAMLAEITEGTSRQQILDALGSDGIQNLRTQAKSVWNAHYCADSATTSLLANSLWLEEGLPYRREAVTALSEQYYASVFQGDLGSPEMNRALQNWLNEQTGGLLAEQAQTVELPPQTVLALASTILYRSKWRATFSEDRNTSGIFHAPGGDREVTFLNNVLTYGPYYWGEGFAAVPLALEDGSRMWLVLPDEGVTAAQVLEDGTALQMLLAPDAYASQTSIRVNLSLPKFDVSANLQLGQALQEMGITEVFQPDAADFSAIVQEGPAWLDQVQHAVRVMIDEEGVSAAAYTVMMTAGAARPPEEEVDFILDRPFLFVVTGHDNLPLFAGVVNQP